MKPPEKPPDESERQAALDSLEILDTPSEERFDRITRLAARLFSAPIALVSLVDGERQWFKSAQNLNATETAREISFCGHAILQHEVFVVPDATSDGRFSDNPLVTGEPSIRFYSGCPLRSPSGARLGTLCVIDRSPREFTDADKQSLEDLARIVEGEIHRQQLSKEQLRLLQELSAAERRAAVDGLTRLWNRDVIMKLLDTEHERMTREGGMLTVAMIDVDHFKSVNDRFGHSAGDEVLRAVAATLRRNVRPYDNLGRYGGEEFLLIMPGCDADAALLAAERICHAVAGQPASGDQQRVTVSIGLCTRTIPAKAIPADILRAADQALYKAKATGRDRVCVAPAPMS